MTRRWDRAAVDVGLDLVEYHRTVDRLRSEAGLRRGEAHRLALRLLPEAHRRADILVRVWRHAGLPVADAARVVAAAVAESLLTDPWDAWDAMTKPPRDDLPAGELLRGSR